MFSKVNFYDLKSQIKNKKIVLFGAGNIADKTLEKLDYKPKYIADNSPLAWGNYQKNIQIINPSKILNKKNVFFLITTTAFNEVGEQLKNEGLKVNKDFNISPILNDLLTIFDLENVEKNLIFSSGAQPHKDKKFGGGLYKMEINGDKWSYNKIHSGNCYGLIRVDNDIICIDTNNGILKLNNNLKIKEIFKLKKGFRAHGISYSNKTKKYYLGCSYKDSILVFNKDFKYLNEIKLRQKNILESAQLHINDCYAYQESLFVSMFSVTGNWKKDLFDGGIIEIDLKTQKVKNILCNDLWMPHNVCFFDKSLHVLDSLRGHLKTNNLSIIGTFNAFTRGLDFDQKYYYIGQSKNRNHSKNVGLSNNISIDAGIVIFDPQSKVSRFLQVSPRLSEIHHLLLI